MAKLYFIWNKFKLKKSVHYGNLCSQPTNDTPPFKCWFHITFIDQNLGGNFTNLAEIVGPRVVYGVVFYDSEDPWSLVGPGCPVKCQMEWWSGLLRESQGSRPCWTMVKHHISLCYIGRKMCSKFHYMFPRNPVYSIESSLALAMWW